MNVLAMAERARGGPASRFRNYAVVKVSSGVGCGLVVNGGVVRGSDGYAGDIGHVCIDPASEAVCACGSKGCLEAFVSAPALVRDATALAESGASPALAELLAAGPLSMAVIGQAAQMEDPAATAQLRAAGRHVGYAIAGLVTVLNPAAVFRLFDFDRAISMTSGLRPAVCGCSGIVSGGRSSRGCGIRSRRA